MPFPQEPQNANGWRFLSNDEKELLVAKRHADYARLTGDIPTLIENLIITGEWTEAKRLGSEEAAELIKAEARSDKTRCKCPMPETGKKFLRSRPVVWCKKRDGIRPVRKCFQCGFLQITDGELDEVSATINEARSADAKVSDAQLMRGR